MPPYETHPPPFVALGAMPMQTLRNAYAAAIRRRVATIGTLDLLVQVAVYEKRTPPWLLAGSRANLMQMAADPHRIPAGRAPGEQGAEPLSEFDPEVRSALREVEWRTRRTAGRLSPVKRSDIDPWDRRPRWTAGARAMLTGALRAARDHRVPFASLTHLMYAMLEMPNCDGTRYVYPYEYARVAAVERLSKEPNLRRPDQTYPDLDDVRLTMWPRSRPLLGRLAGQFLARMSRLVRVGPLLNSVETEARRQAIRCGHGVVGPAHTLLAMLVFDATLAAARIPVPAYYSSRNRGASVLRAHGVNADSLRRMAAHRGVPEEPPTELLTKQLERLRPGDPFDDAETVATAARAMELSLAYRHPDTGTSHLLLALIENDAGEAAALLRELDVDTAAVRERVEQDLRTAPAAWPSPTGE